MLPNEYKVDVDELPMLALMYGIIDDEASDGAENEDDFMNIEEVCRYSVVNHRIEMLVNFTLTWLCRDIIFHLNYCVHYLLSDTFVCSYFEFF